LQARLELKGLNYKGKLLALPTNVRLEGKGMAMATTPAFYNTAIGIALKI
jgi:hypothetical protein